MPREPIAMPVGKKKLKLIRSVTMACFRSRFAAFATVDEISSQTCPARHCAMLDLNLDRRRHRDWESSGILRRPRSFIA